MPNLCYAFPRSPDPDAFKHLGRLLSCPMTSIECDKITIGSQGLADHTVLIHCDVDQTDLYIAADSKRYITPAAFFAPVSLTHKTSLQDAADALAGKIVAIDHTGLVIPSRFFNQTIVNQFALDLGQHLPLYEYPSSPEYDPTKTLWLFAIPRRKHNSPGYTQPAFEFVCDQSGIDHTIVQIDVETTLERSEIAELLLDSYELPGLGEYFRSLNIQSPWPGIGTLRLDLRYKEPNKTPDHWNTGAWIRDQGRHISSVNNTP
jgi:hypothetical protein